MTVKYATQLFSESVAKALDYCREVLKLPEFEHSEATSEFCQIMGRIFNIMNSSNPNLTSDSKAAFTAENKASILKTFDETALYIRNLKTPKEIRIIDDRKKTGVLGILSNIEALMLVYLNLIDSDLLKFIPTRKLN